MRRAFVIIKVGSHPPPASCASLPKVMTPPLSLDDDRAFAVITNVMTNVMTPAGWETA